MKLGVYRDIDNHSEILFSSTVIIDSLNYHFNIYFFQIVKNSEESYSLHIFYSPLPHDTF